MFTELLKQKFIKLSKNKRGNFAMIAAIVAPLLLAAGGLAIDIANQTALKTRFQAASDSVSLVVATRIANGDLTVANAEEFGKSLLEAQMANDHSRFSNLRIEPVVNITETINGGNSTWDVKVGGTATQDTTPFAAFLNKETTSATVSSIARAGKEEVRNALSMVLVTDVSGSMAYSMGGIIGTSRIAALKSAAAQLFAQFNEADKDNKYVRTGVASYSNGLQGKTKMEWGTNAAQQFVSGLWTGGGTASSQAVKWAYNRLKISNTTESNEHLAKNGQREPDRFILFLTDGNNNGWGEDGRTRTQCDKAKNDGIEVFTVALSAPLRGRQLLNYCASAPKSEHYFEANTTSALVETFKEIGSKTAKSLTRLTN